MYINSLPDDVLVRIFRCSKECTYQLPSDWDKLLPMISVCSRWRWLSTPLVYSSAFIIARPLYSQTPTTATTKQQPPELCSGEYTSNIPLALATKSANFIRELSIEADEIEKTLAFMSGIASIADTNRAISWQKIQTLTLRQLFYKTNQDPRHQRLQKRMTKKFTRFITNRMTNILNLQCLIINHSPQGSDIGNQLTDYYAGRLKQVKSLIPLTLSVSKLSCQLTHLQISISNEAGHQLPLICKDSLKHLSLCNVPRNYRWEPFADNSMQQSIVFPRLEHLEIYYKLVSHTVSTASNDRQLSFTSPEILQLPVLKHLYLFRCFEHCQILESSVFPPRLENVLLNCCPTLLLHLLTHEWESINHLNVNIELCNISNPQLFLECTNSLYGKTSVAQTSSLTIGEIPMSVNIAGLDWSHMTSLTIIYQLEVSNLLTILDNLVNLSDLSVLSLDVYSLPAYILQKFRSNGAFQNIKTNSKLQHAKIHAIDIEPCASNYLAFIRYFATRYISLKNLNVSPSALFYTQVFVRSFSQMYPHLLSTNVFALGSTNY